METQLARSAPPIWMARCYLTHHANRSFRWGLGGFMEADGDLNDASRLVIRAYVMHYGTPWLGNINIYRTLSLSPHDRLAMWQHSADAKVYNFQGNFIVPHYDPELERLILTYNDLGSRFYSGDKTVAIPKGGLIGAIEAIYDRVVALGGTMLCWS